MTRKLPYLIIACTGLCLPFVLFSSAKDTRQGYTVSGELNFEDFSSNGARIYFTTQDVEQGYVPSKRETIMQLIGNDGLFERDVNQDGGNYINIWIEQQGYPIIHLARTAVSSNRAIDLGKIKIPYDLRSDSPSVIQIYRSACDPRHVQEVLPSDIMTLRNFDAHPSCSEQGYQLDLRADVQLKSGELYAIDETGEERRELKFATSCLIAFAGKK